MASATPDCEEPAQAQSYGLMAYEPPTDLAVISGEEAATANPKRELKVSPRPRLRPCKFRQIEIGREKMRKRGAVCSDWTIVGENRKPFSGKLRGCGIAEPVRISIVSDVLLSQLAMMDCKTAVTLKTWLENTAKPAFADQGGGLKGLRLSGHYACKTQNNQPGRRLSEHAHGRAIDISSFILMDGTVITVRDGWANKGTEGVMRELHAGACGLFGTVLGPDADRYHKGHFHFDLARRRGGSYCR
ncbi:extensin family protein [Roseovarius arcticus]|uniref:extensin-like domain-containing protein n=1 Tax=Roseovarius arcticus TaxID=2547404 RepID=UPI001BB1F0A9|nr:extensin family protein [Roseovarius arcticus]